jgi:hypothetical protein
MKLNFFLPILSVTSATSYCPSRSANSTEQLSIFNQFVQKFYYMQYIKSAFKGHFYSPSWVEHSPDASPGTLDQTIIALTGLTAISNFAIYHTGFYNNTG